MPNYKDLSEKVHFLDDASFAHLLPEGCVEITEEEAFALLNLPPTAEQKIQAVKVAVQAHLDAAAVEKGYDDIKAAVTYADEPSVPKFQAEGQVLRAWRSLVWAKCYEIQDAVFSGARLEPTMDELLAELPVLEWV